jgi:hypothetical protein
MSQELIQKKIRIASKTLDKINQLIKDYEIDNESRLYREFIEIGYAIKKKQLDGDLGNGYDNFNLDANKRAKYHSILLEKIAKKILDIDDNEISKIFNETTNYNHEVLANIASFHDIDNEKIKDLKKQKINF